MFKSIVVLSALVLAASDPDWSRFRGPNGTGIAETSGLPAEFGPAKNVVWKTAMPPGHSSPVLTRTHIFLTGADGDKLVVLAVDRATGKELWRRQVPRNRTGRLENVNGPASPSPVTDGDRVYAFFQDFGLVAYSADGKEQWRLPLGPFNMFYGFGASPILVDGTTPTVYQPKDGPTQVLIPESFQLSAYDVKDGRRTWWVRGLACEMKSVVSIEGDTAYVNGWGFPQNQVGQQVPTVPFEEGLKLYDKNKDGRIADDEVTGGPPALDKMLNPKYGFPAFDGDRDGKLDAKEWDVMRAMLAAENGLLAIKLGGKGDVTDGAIKWKYQRPVPQVPSTLLYKGVLFMINDSGILLSIDPATGAVLKQGRLKGAIDKYFASPVGADGKVFLVSQDGTASVVDAKGDWEILSVNPLDDEVFATPAIADGRIYLRTKSTLYAFAAR
jgi:outer membrane protein assembly factor BamB